jgi:protein-S-isoprenylcysteine O-methyltransferase Ste14
MNRTVALIGAAVWFMVAPGLLGGYVPWLITGWRAVGDVPTVLEIAGAALIVIATAGLIDSFLRFALTGRGTPSPLAPPRHLVVTGLYRRVRNPMYVTVLVLILGQVLVLCRVELLAYGVVLWIALHLLVAFYEEPGLRRQFAAEYTDYCAAVPRWIPRLVC